MKELSDGIYYSLGNTAGHRAVTCVLGKANGTHLNETKNFSKLSSRGLANSHNVFTK